MPRLNLVPVIVVVLFLSFVTTGCAVLLIGTGGAIGGYALSQDSAEGYVDYPMDRVWNASREILKSKGAIVSENRADGKIEASVDEITVKVQIKELTSKTTKLKVSARKSLLPKVKVAQDIYVRIAKRVG
ncbi:MAG: DUF3568 family protein [Candidatus Omnitrophica bacterium]|nr:DUF3568 family protein [Candidatus Omnitrophota bacterium]